MQQESNLDDSLASADYFDRVDYDYQHTDLERYLNSAASKPIKQAQAV